VSDYVGPGRAQRIRYGLRLLRLAPDEEAEAIL